MIPPKRHTPLLPGTLKNLFYPPEKNEYVYFRDDKSTFPTAAPIEKAAWAADAAMLAYAHYGSATMPDEDVEANFARAGLQSQLIGSDTANWNAHGTQLVFASCDDFAICTFRGTERDDPRDIAWDVDVFLTPERPANPLNLLNRGLTIPSLAHRGFQQALREVWTPLNEAIGDYRSRHPQSEICFTGHSLGAALAVLAFSRFDDPNTSLYTFGCPRVGNAAFRDRVLSNPGKGINRYVNVNDAVTHIPTDSLFYRQTPPTCSRIDPDGNLGTDDDSHAADVEALTASLGGLLQHPDLLNLDTPAPPSLVDHSPARYCFRLWDFV